MKASIAALGLAATLANATAFRPEHWHYRRDNSTLPSDAQTTLTVIATEVHTVTSCAPTVTNCPANPTDIEELPETDKTTYIETITRDITTTVCPVSEAPAISSSIIESATKTGAIPTDGDNVPATGAASEALPVATTTAPVSLTTQTSEVVEDQTMTITHGSGDVETTVVHTTYQTTVTVPCSVTPGEEESSASEESTTTTTATTTNTVTLTVEPPAATDSESSPEGGSGGIPSDTEGDNSEGDSSNDGSCVCPSAVTVTVPASTVYITMGGDESAPTATPTGSVEHETEAEDEDAADGEDDEDVDDDEDEYDECEPDETTTLTATTHIPYPTGNGTGPIVPGPTGFAKRFRF
ncbi:uncharacterized protein F5Z01DRAFT_411983 [Emericellopsis atlantica]|uniref:Uncharacterized protein n=1 Tax=Emericellopsis atlantica TaxID=2614577 RepID=A0A9P7ZU50_9HYPO|nr:uncharacterized protein F5Z01DRAFT_411983 [Emericellopsis atlantica]KAG9257720.1 hypothetical protein F5Z01DRAFT_411983 [Emericellopsis atlantica]